MDWKAELDALIAAVKANKTVEASVEMFAKGLAKIAKAVKDDSAAVEAFADGLIASAPKAADAVIANTPKQTK